VYLVKCAINTFNIELRIPYSLFDGLAVEERGSVVYDKRNNHSYLCLNNAIARIETDSSSLYKSRVKRSLWISGMRAIDEFSGERKTLVDFVSFLAGKWKNLFPERHLGIAMSWLGFLMMMRF
jgi:hypothetical protein